MEEFRLIKDFENYSASNLGNIKNNKTGRILKPGIDKQCYYFVTLYKDKKPFFKNIHRLVADAFLDNPLNKNCVDHFDSNRLNNKIENLRFATTSENNMNRKINSNNISGFKGIHFHKKLNKWCAQIQINGKKQHLGLFENIEDAINARVKKAKEIFGEFINTCEKEIDINLNIPANTKVKLNINIKTDEDLELEELEKEFEDILKR
jgi:hypothetical protein